MNFKSHLRLSALMLGLSLCGGLLNVAGAAPAKDGTAKPGKAGKAGKRGEGKGERRGGERRGGGMGMKMMQELNLTDAQKAKLKPIMEAQRDQMKEMREDTTMDRQAKMTKMKAMRDEMEEKVSAILTSDQKKKLAEMKAKMKAERAAGGREAGGKDGAGKGKRADGGNGGKGGKGGRGGGPQAPAPAL